MSGLRLSPFSASQYTHLVTVKMHAYAFLEIERSAPRLMGIIDEQRMHSDNHRVANQTTEELSMNHGSFKAGGIGERRLIAGANGQALWSK